MSAEANAAAALDLQGREPVLQFAEDGLQVKGYRIDGDFVLDFDWEPGGSWSFLDDLEAFKAFVVRWLEQMTGQAMEAEQIAQLRVSRTASEAALGQQLTGQPEQQ